jgi:recyclin-1
LEGIRSLFSIEVALNLIHTAKSSLERMALFVRLGGQSGEEAREQCENIFVSLLQIMGPRHIQSGFDQAVNHLSVYNPREISEHGQAGVEPLVTFLELVNVGDLIQQMVDVFYAQELVAAKLSDPDDFLSPAVKEKKRFEQILDERVAAGLNKGIDVLMDEVEYICATTQQLTDFNPTTPIDDIGPSATAKRVIEIVGGHTSMLVGSTEKNMLDVFNQEVGLRLFTVLCKHLKRQRISVDGAIKLISDTNHYKTFISKFKNKSLNEYFDALSEMCQIYLIDGKDAREIGKIIADPDRYKGVFRAEEVYEFAERRADWFGVKRDVERAMYGMGCAVM